MLSIALKRRRYFEQNKTSVHLKYVVFNVFISRVAISAEQITNGWLLFTRRYFPARAHTHMYLFVICDAQNEGASHESTAAVRKQIQVVVEFRGFLPPLEQRVG